MDLSQEAFAESLPTGLRYFFLAPFVVAGSDRGAIIKVAVGLVSTPTTVPQTQSAHVGYGIK
jgi:hypothetical protein